MYLDQYTCDDCALFREVKEYGPNSGYCITNRCILKNGKDAICKEFDRTENNGNQSAEQIK